MPFVIPIWARFAITAAWAVLKRVLASAGVPPIAISAVEAVMQTLGLLGSAELTHAEVQTRAIGLHDHCGIACPPDLVAMP